MSRLLLACAANCPWCVLWFLDKTGALQRHLPLVDVRSAHWLHRKRDEERKMFNLILGVIPFLFATRLACSVYEMVVPKNGLAVGADISSGHPYFLEEGGEGPQSFLKHTKSCPRPISLFCVLRYS